MKIKQNKFFKIYSLLKNPLELLTNFIILYQVLVCIFASLNVSLLRRRFLFHRNDNHYVFNSELPTSASTTTRESTTAKAAAKSS
jgi:hypothetical protein